MRRPRLLDVRSGAVAWGEGGSAPALRCRDHGNAKDRAGHCGQNALRVRAVEQPAGVAGCRRQGQEQAEGQEVGAAVGVRVLRGVIAHWTIPFA